MEPSNPPPIRGRVFFGPALDMLVSEPIEWGDIVG
jgi:hypothetical protein